MIALLGTGAFILIFVIIFQMARTNELMSVLRGQQEGEVSESTNRSLGIFFFIFLILSFVGIVWSVLKYKEYFLPESASIHGVEIDSMFNLTLLLTGIVFVITHILLFYFPFRYWGSMKRKALYYPHNNKLELIWTIIPSIVLTILIIYGLRAWLHTTGPAPENAIVVEATAQQFNWIIRYPGEDGTLGKREFEEISAENQLGIIWSDASSKDDFIPTEIHLPVNQPVLFKLGAKDVLHSFYLAHFRVKMDCVPGIPTQFWFTPTITTAEMREKTGNENFDYELACAELCGSAHWNMRVKLTVGTEEEHQEWLAQQKPIYESFKANLENESEESLNAQVDEDEEEQHREDLISAL